MSSKAEISEIKFRFKFLTGMAAFGAAAGFIGFIYYITNGVGANLPDLFKIMPIIWPLIEFQMTVLLSSWFFFLLGVAWIWKPWLDDDQPTTNKTIKKPW